MYNINNCVSLFTHTHSLLSVYPLERLWSLQTTHNQNKYLPINHVLMDTHTVTCPLFVCYQLLHCFQCNIRHNYSQKANTCTFEWILLKWTYSSVFSWCSQVISLFQLDVLHIVAKWFKLFLVLFLRVAFVPVCQHPEPYLLEFNLALTYHYEHMYVQILLLLY